MKVIVSVVGTGWEFEYVEATEFFVGTAQLPDGTVWHVFAREVE
jgi:hypothetical protein